MDIKKLTQLRHWLHAHPEISRQERQTAQYLRDFLQQHAPPDQFVDLHGAGFAAVYNGDSRGKTVMFRCELDALPIHEINDNIDYRSVHDGVGHKCGHDGHMTILAGLALQLVSRRPAKGRVVLLFQPDEETGSGAKSCCEHQNFAQIAPDAVFALHNLPGFPSHQIICKPGVFSSEVKYLAVKLSGKEAHSAQPETGVSPSMALAELTLKACDIQAKYDRPDAYALVVPVYSQMGVQASGVCPAFGEAQFTLRSADAAVLDEMWSGFSRAAKTIAERHGLKVEFEIKEHFLATHNSPSAVEMIKQAASDVALDFIEIEHAFRWGEDFGELTRRYEGAMFGLGAGVNRPDLHNPDYDFPDEILASGINMFAALASATVNEPKTSSPSPHPAP